jgi:Mycothiol maleylpyruvate isomerase N-terminal domain
MTSAASATDQLDALDVSVHRLASLVNGLKLAELNQQAYPSKWSVADVLSHLGSGAAIMQRGIDAAVSGHPIEDGFRQSVWDEWNAKGAAAKAADALVADRQLLDRVVSLTDAQRDSFPARATGTSAI